MAQVTTKQSGGRGWAKKLLIALGALIVAMVLVVGGYVLYVVLSYNRIPDNQALVVEMQGAGSRQLQAGTSYTALTFNIGFGAYDHDFSFFLDEGAWADGTPTVGSESRAASEELVERNTALVITQALAEQPDILLLQEVDVRADRSWGVNQRARIVEALPGAHWYDFATNFHSSYLFYPPTKPIGQIADSGLLTISSYEIASAERRSLPVSDGFPTKYFDLDRCLSISRLPVVQREAATQTGATSAVPAATAAAPAATSAVPAAAPATDSAAPAAPATAQTAQRELVLINIHPSAFDEGGIIRAQQMEALASIMTAEYAAGNYVIVGGDFNHAFGGSEQLFLGGMQQPAWVQPFDDSLLPSGFRAVLPSNLTETGTCRDTSVPYEQGVSYEVVLDGFIVSDNVQASTTIINANYQASDHNPVRLSFTLLP